MLFKRPVITPIFRTGVVEITKIDASGAGYQLIVHRTDYEAWIGGALIQNVFPNLSAVQRDFLVTGRTPWEQDQIFSTNDD